MNETEHLDLTAEELRALAIWHRERASDLERAAQMRDGGGSNGTVAVTPRKKGDKAPRGQRLRELRSYVAQHGPVSQAHIVEQTGWPVSTVSTQLRKHPAIFGCDEQGHYFTKNGKEAKEKKA